MQEAKQLVINLVTWNSVTYLPNLFASFDQQDIREFTITVVDNASNDGVARWLSENHPEVTTLRNFRNQGFARAHNQAIALALSRWPEETWTHRYVLLCNPDIELEAACLRRLVKIMETDVGIAACGPKLLRAIAPYHAGERCETERTNVIDSTGICLSASRRAVDRGAGEEDRGQYDHSTDVFGLSGACVVLRASAIVASKLGDEFLDEDFFAYKEDVDLAWRMRRLGMRARFVPDARAWHHRCVPSLPNAGVFIAWKNRRTKSPLINYLSTRNHWWLLLKNDELLNVIIHAHRMLPYEIAKVFASVSSWSALKGQCAALFGIWRMWRKRQALASRVRVSGSGMRQWFI